MPTAPRKRLLAGLTIALTAAVCLALLAGYLGWRVRAYRDLDLVLEGDFPIEKDAEIGFVPVRNGSSLRRHPRAGLAYHVFTSDRRARVSRRGERTPPRADLVTVGCSFSWGHGVEAEDTYTSVLGRRLGAPVANFAFSAYGTVQSLQMLRRVEDLRPKVVVYGFIADHMKRNLSPCAPAYGPVCLPFSHVGVSAEGAPVVRPPDPALFDFNRRFWDEFFFTKATGPRQLATAAEAEWVRLVRTPKEEAPDTPAFREASLASLLGAMRDAATAAGARLVVVHIPYLERGTTNDAPGPLRAALAATPGVLFLDLTPAVRRHYATPDAPLLRFERDRHPNPLAHGLIADELGRFLEDRHLVRSDGPGPAP